MIETTEQTQTADQIQKPVIPAPALAEIPAPSLPELPPPPAATETPAQAPAPDLLQPDGSTQDEAALTDEIVQLWQVHQDCQSAIKQETQQFRSLRSELGRLLYQMKALLAKPGRAGEWSGWLRERRIPRATADRLVAKYERSLNLDGNRLTEAISEPTEEEIKTLLDKLMPKLRKALPTPMSLYRFLDLLASSFEGVERRVTEAGIVIVNPAQPAQAAIEQSAPDGGQVKPVPVIADVLADTDVQSPDTSMAL